MSLATATREPTAPLCTLCRTDRDVYAPVTRTGLRMPPMCGRCQHHVNVTARGLLQRTERSRA